MPSITLNIENTMEDLDRASVIIHALRALHSASPGNDRVDIAVEPIAAWFNRLGVGSKSFWARAARHSQTQSEWTFDDLAQSPEDKKTLRSNHRNSYRAIKVEGASNPLQSRWDAYRECQVYQMPNIVRDEILRLLTQTQLENPIAEVAVPEA